jgi:hypothetical protein
VRYWHSAGRLSGTREMGTFEGWSAVVPGMVLAVGRAFRKEWDCLLDNENEAVGDRRGRDYKRLGELAMAEYGVDAAGLQQRSFTVTVSQLAGVARRHGIEEAMFQLFPEKDVESVLATEGRSGGWSYKEPNRPIFGDEEKEEESHRQAAEFLTPKSRSSFGKALQDMMQERYLKHTDGAHYIWRHMPGQSPARYSCERV